MNSRAYEKAILERLISKKDRRDADGVRTSRRIIVKPSEMYSHYNEYNADLLEKEAFSEAVEKLSEKGFIGISVIRFSSDIEKIYLKEDMLDLIHRYLSDEFGVALRDDIAADIRSLLERYGSGGKLTEYYHSYIEKQLAVPGFSLDTERVRRNLMMLDFLDKNKRKLYVREVSISVYGDSKWFEENNYDEICMIAGLALNMPENSPDINGDDILQRLNIMASEQDIFIKGAWIIEWTDYKLDVLKIPGGISVTSADAQNIIKVTVESERMITVENKTSYQRMSSASDSYMYLGGFASRYQILFLRKVISDNPKIKYCHFGDIDVGGFFIHRHLCHETGHDFELYKMGISELRDPRFAGCLRPLTSNDLVRMESLITDETYHDVLSYMKEKNVKLEQEIILVDFFRQGYKIISNDKTIYRREVLKLNRETVRRIKGLMAIVVALLIFACSGLPAMAADYNALVLKTGDSLEGGDKVYVGESGDFYVHYNGSAGTEFEFNFPAHETIVSAGSWKVTYAQGMYNLDDWHLRLTSVNNDPVIADEPVQTKAVALSTPCEHDYQYVIENEPTEDTTGLMVEKCTKCGDIRATQVLPAIKDDYNRSMYEKTKQILNAKAGQMITVDIGNWDTLPKSFFEALSNKRDIALKVRFM